MTPAIFWQESTWFTNSECLKLTQPSFDLRKKNVRSCRSDMREIFCRACSNPQEVGRFFSQTLKKLGRGMWNKMEKCPPWKLIKHSSSLLLLQTFYPGLFTNKTENKENYYRLYTQSVSQWKEKNGPTNSSLTNSQNTFFCGGGTKKSPPPNKIGKKSSETKKPTAALLCLVSPREKKMPAWMGRWVSWVVQVTGGWWWFWWHPQISKM